MIHRDIKPANVMVDREGRVKKQGRTEEARTMLERVHADLEREGAPAARLAVSRRHLDELQEALEHEASAAIEASSRDQ